MSEADGDTLVFSASRPTVRRAVGWVVAMALVLLVLWIVMGLAKGTSVVFVLKAMIPLLPFLVLVIAVDWLFEWIIRRTLAFPVGPDALILPLKRPLRLPYRNIRGLSRVNHPFERPGFILIKTDSCTYATCPQQIDEFAGCLSQRTGLEVSREPFVPFILRQNWKTFLFVSGILAAVSLATKHIQVLIAIFALLIISAALDVFSKAARNAWP